MTGDERPSAHVRERIVPIKILGHWEDARVHVTGGDLFIDIPGALIALVEADHPGVGARFGYQLLIERFRIVDLVQGRPRRRATHVGACPECGARAGLHALSCSRFVRSTTVSGPDEPPRPLTEAALVELRALPPSAWEGWPPDDYDQGLPVVEIRQDHLKALLDEVQQRRNEARDPSSGRPGYDEHGVFLGEGHRQQLEDEHAVGERQRRLERAADAVERGQLDLSSPDELAAMRRLTVGGWHERLGETFHGGVDADGCWWIWHNGLGTYGDGGSYEQAKADMLAEIADALDEWRQLTEA